MTVIRTPDQRLRVFVSSTIGELAEERAAAKSAIEALHLTPVLFELGARPHPPRALYRAYLEQSHVFVGIYWESYGWTAPGEALSGIEDEYNLSGDKPRLVYVREPAPDREPRLVAMLDRIASDGLSYRTFHDANELREMLLDDLALLLSEMFERTEQAEGVVAARPAERTLPAPPSRFVGRDRELHEIARALMEPETRLLTLLGPGGIGKTRLAIEVARELQARFDDGVGLVQLDAIPSPDLVPGAITAAFRIPESAVRPPEEALVAYLESREMLLVLDNFEHVVAAAPLVGDLLTSCPRLTILVTSRELLNLSAEHVYAVPPMTLPEPAAAGRPVRRSEAVQLFLDRARAVRPDLPLDDEDLTAIAEICRRLDGLPLAIELAAARVRLLSPRNVLTRLEQRLDLLTSGPSDLPERQRTLRNTIAWSHDLLAPHEAHLFARLAVFRGGFSLDAAEAVCAGEGVPDVLDALSSLVDKSLVQLSEQGRASRFRLLETVRAFALERLDERGELDERRRVHADYFIQAVRDANERFRTAEDRALVEEVTADYGNLREVIRWALERDEPGRLVDLGHALWQYWWMRSRFDEGISWMQAALAYDTLPDEQRARAEFVLGMLLYGHGDFGPSVEAFGRAQRLYEAIGDRYGVAVSSIGPAVVMSLQDPEEGVDVIERAIATLREFDDPWELSRSLFALGRVLILQNRGEEAVGYLEESVDHARATGAHVLLGFALINLGWARLLSGDTGGARRAFRESLEVVAEVDNRESMARALEGLAATSLADGDPERGAVLFGAAEGARRSIGAGVWPTDMGDHERTEQELRAALGDEEFDATFGEGTDYPPIETPTLVAV